MADIQTFVNTLDTRLSTIAGLRVYQGPIGSVNEFPCTIIQDHNPLAQYTVSSQEAAYFLTITLLDSASDPQEAWVTLEPYLAAGGAQSIRAAVDLTSDPDMSYIHVISSSNRQLVKYGGGSYWGAVLVVEGRVNVLQ